MIALILLLIVYFLPGLAIGYLLGRNDAFPYKVFFKQFFLWPYWLWRDIRPKDW